MKSEKLKIQITPSNQRPRAEILICIFHFLLFTFHLSKSVANPLQIRCKSHSCIGVRGRGKQPKRGHRGMELRELLHDRLQEWRDSPVEGSAVAVDEYF